MLGYWLQAPKKEKAPPPSSKPAKSGGGKQKKKVKLRPILLNMYSHTLKLCFLFCVGGGGYSASLICYDEFLIEMRSGYLVLMI